VAAAEAFRAVGPDRLTEIDPTPGIIREIAFATDRVILVRARAEGGVASGWHHHGDREVLGYLVKGRAPVAFGSGGTERTEVEEGGFFYVPLGLVHRDVNPTDEPQEFVLAFVDQGPLVVNVEEPTSA
jgi:uncharacterized RmlC-like cupin family protein